MSRLRALLFALLPVLALGVAPVFAQQGGIAPEKLNLQSPILTIDSERFFKESAFGVRVAREVERQGSELNAENRQIETLLEAEEKQLTERRATMDPEAFRKLADAFDDKVQQIRDEQAAKGRALGQRVDSEREEFLAAAGPVLEDLMRAAGAAVIMERLSVFVSANAIDITDEAIRRIDASLGTREE